MWMREKVDEGKAADVAYMDFNKPFITVSHSILMEKLAARGLGRYSFLLRKEPARGASPQNGGEWN